MMTGIGIKFVKCYFFFFLVLLTPTLFGQITSYIKPSLDSVGLGDPISVDIKITLPPGIDIKGLDFSDYKKVENKSYQQDTITMEPIADLEIIDFGQWKHESLEIPISSKQLTITEENGQKVIQNTIKIAFYNAGIFAIPVPKVISDETSIQTIQGQSAIIRVSLPEKLMKQDTVTFNPIKDIIKEKADFSDYLIYLYVLGGLLLITFIGYYFYKIKKRNNKISPITVDVFVPCHEKALQALKQLEEKSLWQKGMIKEYQSGLTDIVRTYLQERYHINAPEMTTDEIIINLNTADFDQKYSYELVNILQIADLVKFAKARPDENIHALFMAKAVDFIENTKEATIAVKEI